LMTFVVPMLSGDAVVSVATASTLAQLPGFGLGGHTLTVADTPADLLAPGAGAGLALASSVGLDAAATVSAATANALALLAGHIYLAFGGYSGDCGPYHGIVVGIELAHPHVSAAWATAALKGGIWNPGGIVSDGKSLFVATGNTEGATQWGGGEAVLRLSPGLRPLDYFVPDNWKKLDTDDLDLGGVNPTLIDMHDASVPKLLLALGKDGAAYLVNRRHLGGISKPLARHPVSPDPIRSSTAKYRVGRDMMVVVNAHGIGCTGDDGVVALRVRGPNRPGPAIETAWCHRIDGRGAPVVTQSGRGMQPVVWIFGAEGDERLRAFDGVTGAVLYVSDPTLAPVPHFSTPLIAEHRLYLPAKNTVLAFTLHAAPLP
ncbi:MAG: hypothetical protein POG24_11225, partial [Acidocella sp.]|nr:hypothetical protein [Acidocella sp.]